MNVKTITCHDVYNYGASLQAFALQKIVEQSGNRVEIIDYKPSYLRFPYRFEWFVHPDSSVKKYTDKSKLVHFLYCLKRYLWYLPTLNRKHAFDEFTKRFLKATRTYRSYEELLADTPKADTYIVGSDQVWNSITMLNGLDPAFYLQFAPEGARKISYAASFGSNQVSEQHRSQIQAWIGSLDAISVRESTGLNLLSDLGLTGIHVCDPVFLLSYEEWCHLLSIDVEKKGYVLIYNLTARNEKLIQDALSVSRQMGVPLYSVSPFKIAEAEKSFVEAGPSDFVRLIFGASYVFTNSFHATAFSIISHQQFFTYNYHSVSNSSRMYSLLKDMDLLGRLNIDDISSALNNEIDYSKVSELVEAVSLKGKTWLNENL